MGRRWTSWVGAIVVAAWVGGVAAQPGGAAAPTRPPAGPAPTPPAGADPTPSPPGPAPTSPGVAAPTRPPAGPPPAPPAGAVDRAHLVGRAAPALVSGILSRPAAGPPAEVARVYLRAAPEVLGGVDPDALRVERTHALPVGALVRLRHTYRGLDVVGGAVAVRLDTEGRVRWVSATTTPVPAELDATPRVPAAEAIARALAAPGLRRPPAALDPARHARLVVWAPPGRAPRLVWRVILPPDLVRLRVPRVTVDARTGELVWAEDLARRDRRAAVYLENPIRTPELAIVTLDLPPAAGRLEGPDIVARNCVDRSSCPLVDGSGTHYRFCEIEPVATANIDGDFLYERPAIDTDPEDAFAEVQMYHHATGGYAYFRGLGLDALRTRPMTVLVNLRVPSDADRVCAGTTSSAPLRAYDNAFQSPPGAFIPGVYPPDDQMIFGQGVMSDYAYDGDVVIHEFVHAVMYSVSSLGVVASDEVGLDNSMAAMHEGFADYFAAAYTGDPDIGDYAGRGIPGRPPGPIRRLVNDRRCPEHLDGEEHDDSEIFSGALWEVRARLEADDRPAFDRAVYTVVAGLGELESFDLVRRKILAEVAASQGDAVHALATEVFAERGLDGCGDRIVEVTEQSLRNLYVYGTDFIPGYPLIPASLQFRFDVPGEASEIRVSIRMSMADRMGEGTPGIVLLAKRGAPIRWEPNRLTHDAPLQVDATIRPGNDGAGEAVLRGDFGKGVYYLQFANRTDTWFLGGLAFSSDAIPELNGSCGCGVGRAAGAGGGAALAVAGAALALLRRRRARTIQSGERRPSDP